MTKEIGNLLVALLKVSKESELIHISSQEMVGVAEKIEAISVAEGLWNIPREARIEIAIKAISAGVEPEIVVESMTWKDFEGLVAQILSEHNYHCTESFRRRGTAIVRGMEIDVIGVRGQVILAIDAKMWGIRSGKSTAIRNAVEKQVTRTEELSGQLSRLSMKIKTMKPGDYTVFPVMVTWLVEDVEVFEGVCVVPVFKFNSFLNEFERYQDFLISFDGALGQQFEQTGL